MAYDRKIREEAFQLYCLGYSFDKIVSEMKSTRKRSFKLSKKTVLGWAEKEDWEIRRREVQRQAGRKTNEKLVESLSEIEEQLTAVKGFLIGLLPSGKPSTVTALANSIVKLIKTQVNLTGMDKDSVSMAQAASTIFDIMMEDEELAEVLERKLGWLQKRFEEEARV